MEVKDTIKTLFVISVLTTRMIMPGMPSFPGMADVSAPKKAMTMDLTSDKKVNASSKAQCAVPDGLKVGPKVDLAIDLPVKTTEESGPGESGGNTKSEKFVMKTYWDCSEVVLPGQPKVLDTDQMMKGMPKMPMMGKGGFTPGMGGMRAAIYGDKSHAYWPNEKDGKKIVKDSSTPGPYELTTNYCGGTSITFGKEQDFLAGIDITNPGKGSIDLTKSIKVEWKTVPNAQAYVITAFAGKKGEMVMWTSSSKPDVSVDWMGTPFSKDEIKSYITKGILLPADATYCYIPAGIFKDFSAPMINMIALGVDKSQAKDGIQTNVVVRSNAMMMAGRGMGGAMLEGDDSTSEQPAGNTPTDSTSSSTSTTTTTTTSTTNSTTTDTPKSNSPTQKAKDALHKLGGIFH